MDEMFAWYLVRWDALTWTICHLLECSFLTASSTHIKHTFIALGWDSSMKKLVSVKVKLWLFTITSNNTALHFQILTCTQANEDDGVDVILGTTVCTSRTKKPQPTNKKNKSTFNLCNLHRLLGSSSYPPQAGTCHKISGTSMNTFGAGELALVLCNMKHSAWYAASCSYA